MDLSTFLLTRNGLKVMIGAGTTTSPLQRMRIFPISAVTPIWLQLPPTKIRHTVLQKNLLLLHQILLL